MTSITSRRPALRKQYLVVFILSKLTEQLIDCSLVPQNNAGEQKKYPFVTYNFVEAHRDTTYDHRPDQFDCTLQIEAHSNDQYKSMELVEKLREALVDLDGYRRFFTQAYVVPHEPSTNSSIQDHTISMFGITYDYTFGFDYAFTVGHADTEFKEEDLNFEYDGEPAIESIKAVNALDNTEIRADKEGEI